MRIIDARGKLCPLPLIDTKRALKESGNGDVFSLLLDNKTSLDNVLRFLMDNKTAYSVSESEGGWSVEVTKGPGKTDNVEAEAYCTPAVSHFEKGEYIVVLSSCRIGEGDEELGKKLMKSFFRALHDLDRLPKKILFYNSGVRLATIDSDVINDIKDLERMGVEILLCSTCVDHYGIGDLVAAGNLSNMFAFAEIMSGPDKVVKP
jgi:selenium metabolism protein YedF